MDKQHKPRRNLLITLMGTVLIAAGLFFTPISATNQQQSRFGDWASRQTDVEYRADSDGFVTATIHGYTGDIAGIINGTQICRASAVSCEHDQVEELPPNYNTLTMAVAAGEYWIVRHVNKASSARIRVYWRPMVR